MDNLLAILAVIVGFTIVSKITSFIFRIVMIIAVLLFLYYIYNGGSIDGIRSLLN